ncbi:MAG TPA: hypothetical protein VFJ90_14095 [Candidatus Didemnitutus sp.]|nr:hypothetical protein [Candidatus Didemnitutus sp.]
MAAQRSSSSHERRLSADKFIRPRSVAGASGTIVARAIAGAATMVIAQVVAGRDAALFPLQQQIGALTESWIATDIARVESAGPWP